MRSHAWLNWAEVLTWLVVSLPTLVDVMAGRLPGGLAIAWSAATLTFGALLAVCLWPSRGQPAYRIPLLLVQAACGLLMVYVAPRGASGATLVIVAAQIPYFVGAATAWWWVLAQTTLLIAIFWQAAGWAEGLSAGIAFGGFQMFAVATSFLALSERRAREELTRANAELTATRELLAENTRASERLRISRDLHDTLGHHLTALSLQLDVASRLTSGPAAVHVDQAHAITRLLLADVRDVVSQLRDRSRIDLAATVRSLTAQTSGVEVHIDMPGTFEVEDAGQANTILRCVQEVVTNAARHAGARHLWIRIERTADGIALHARDDGRGSAVVTWGNGLTGMRERFEEHAGRVKIVAAEGRGFEVHGFIPSVGSSS